MKKIGLIMGFILTVFVFTACELTVVTPIITPSGEYDVRTFEMDAFTEFRLGGSFDVVFRYGEDHRVTLEMPENLFDYIEKSVNRGVLNIGVRSGVGIEFGNSRPQVTIYAPLLESVHLSGSGAGTNWDFITATDFTIQTSGSSRLEINLSADNLEMTTSGSSTVNLNATVENGEITASGASNILGELNTNTLEIVGSGSVNVALTGIGQTVDLRLSGAALFDGFDMAIYDGTVNISGSTNVYIYTSQSLDVNASGASSVTYLGNPTVTQRMSGSASVERGE